MLRDFESNRDEDLWVRVDERDESPTTRLASTSESSPRVLDTQPRHISHRFVYSGPGSKPDRETDAQLHLALYWETMRLVACT
jgi:hypothetical protein